MLPASNLHNGLRRRFADPLIKRALSTGEQKEGEIVIFTPKDKQPSFPRVMGIVMYPQMLLVPPAGFYVFHKGSQYEDGWQKYSLMAFGSGMAVLGLYMIPIWRRLSKLFVSRMTLEVEANMLRIEQASFWFPWRNSILRVPTKSVLPGVQPMKDARTGEVMVERMMLQMDTHTQTLMFRGKFENREVFDQLNSGTFVHGAKSAAL